MAVTANYETVMIVSMKKGEEGIQAIVEKFKNLIEKHAQDHRRRHAFHHHQEGRRIITL